MFAWVARLAARRVVWILVGLAVYALLNAAGVRASHIGDLVYTGTSFSLGGGYTGSGQSWAVTPGETYRVTITGYGGGTNNLAISYNGNSCNLSCDAWFQGPTFDFTAVTSSTTAYLGGRDNGGNASGSSFTVHRLTAEPTATPTATASPTAIPTASPTATATATPGPIAGPLCDPYCNVALVPEDRARLDSAFSLDAYIASITALLLTSILVVTGLRR